MMRIRTIHLASLVAVAVGIFVVPPALRQMEILPRRWEALDKGPATGIAWMRLDADAKFPLGPEHSFTWSNHSSRPNDFFFRALASEKTEAFLLVNGTEVPLQINARARGGIFSVQPVREYPPDLESFDLVVKSPGQTPTKFRMHDLPPTRLRFSNEGQTLPMTYLGGVEIQASAWTETPADGKVPYVAAAIRARGKAASGEAWRIQGFGFRTPYAGTDSNDDSIDQCQTLPFRDETTLGLAEVHHWSSTIRSLQVVGRLEQLGTVEDEIDFGAFEVVQPNPAYPSCYSLKLAEPVTATSARGFRVRLEPVQTVRQEIGKDSRLNLRLIADASTLSAGFTDKMRGSTGAPEVAVRLLDRYPHQEISAEDRQPGTPNSVIANLNLKKGQTLRLKLQFVRRAILSEYPFTLYPSVIERSEPAKSLMYFPHAPTASPASCVFIPRPEDFPSALTAHN